MHLNSSGATLPFALRKTSYVELLSSTGPAAAVRVCTWRGSRGISDGSGSSANPCASTEVSKEGRSPNENKTASRAPAASITAISMVRAVWRKSRSAVSSGPKSASASTVRNSFLRLVPCNPLAEAPARNQSGTSVASPHDSIVSQFGASKSIGRSGHRVIGNLEARQENQGYGLVTDMYSDMYPDIYSEGHPCGTFLDRRWALAHTSAKLPAPLAFCRICPAIYRPRESCGCASIQTVSLGENIKRAWSRCFAGNFPQSVRQ